MLSFDLEAVQDFINKPPGQLAAGAVIFGVVSKFFEKVDNGLADTTKFEIALWLVGVNVTDQVRPWPATFLVIFEQTFGSKHWSWKCFRRCSLASISTTILLFCLSFTIGRETTGWKQAAVEFQDIALILAGVCVANVLIDYILMFKTRWLLSRLSRSNHAWYFIVALALDTLVTLYLSWLVVVFLVNLYFMPSVDFRHEPISSAAAVLSSFVHDLSVEDGPLPTLASNFRDGFYYVMIPSLFTSIWLWLYAGAGFLLRVARPLDRVFNWFSHYFDIEKKPVQAIGVVAASILAVTYWSIVAGWRISEHLENAGRH